MLRISLSFLVFPCLADAASLNDAVTPVQKVVQMLDEMKAKGIKEKEDEQVNFAAYKQFCVSTDAEKRKSIKDGTSMVEQLKASIQKAGADAMVLATEIKKLDADIAAFTADKDEATEIRKKDHADYQYINGDYIAAIDAVERALDVLKSGPGQGSAALLQLSSLKVVPASTKKVMESYLQSDVLLQVGAPEAKSYESSSGAVIDMVKDLGKKFKNELYALEKAEATKQGDYDMLAQELTSQIERADKQRTLKSGTKEARLTSKSDDQVSLASTTATLSEDTKFLQDLTVECAQKAIDFAKRQELRQGEIDAIAKAIEIMSGDAVGGGTQHLPSLIQRTTSLVQLRSGSAHNAVQGWVADFLKAKAKTGSSRILAVLAAKVAADPFKKVVKMIRDMIAKLTEEANDEAEHKAFCDTEMSTNKATRDEKTAQSETLKAEVDKLTADTTKLAEEIAGLVEAISENDAAVAKATTIRAEENAKNTATIADATAAAEATTNALRVLKEFYDKASTATAMVQVPGAPETFDKPYTGMGGSATGVVGMLEVIQSDFVRLESETTAAEEEALEAFNQFTADATKDNQVKDEDRKQKSMTKQKKDFELEQVKEDFKTTSEELSAAMEYYEKLKPSCVDAGQSYEERKAQREEEIKSLSEALDILNEQP